VNKSKAIARDLRPRADPVDRPVPGRLFAPEARKSFYRPVGKRHFVAFERETGGRNGLPVLREDQS
jgi:hypothetical protein